MKDIVLRARFGNNDVLDVELAIADSPDLISKAVSFWYAAIPVVWELSENYYRVVLLIDPRMNHVELISLVQDELNEFIIKHIKACHDCIIDDDTLDGLKRYEE